MSSIIVLDSSDEDESPPKKDNLKCTSTDVGITSPSPNSRSNSSKQRNLPSGITITPHNNIGIQTTKAPSPSAMQLLHTSPLLAANINHAITNIIHKERQTPTPPKATVNLAPPLQRKRKSPTSPPTSLRLAPKSFATMNVSNITSPAAAATTIAPLPPIMPMITGVHSMAVAGATPPLQLMATPPHILGNMSGLNEQIMINPNLMHTNMPPNTTITAHTIPNNNQNNINNNFKIHLPPKPLTPSPAASPAATGSKSTSPQLANPGYKVRTEKASKRINPTTILKSTDDAWLQQRPKVMAQADELYRSVHPFNSKDMSWEVTSPSPEYSKSSSRQQTSMASPSTPKGHKLPDATVLKSTDKTSAVFDLTSSPDKPSFPSVIPLDSKQLKSDPNNQCEKQLNGGSGKNSLVGANEKHSNYPEEDLKLKSPPKTPLEPEFEELIYVCQKADSSVDMKKLIKTKLIKYYYEVHGDFVKSKSFRKSIRKVVAAIRAEPDLVYYNLTTIVEELKVRRKAKVVEVPPILLPDNEDTAAVDITTKAEMGNDALSAEDSPVTTVAANASTSTSTPTLPIAYTGNKKLDDQIKKLNKALYVLTKRIEVLEQSEVDWDDDDSSFLQVERFKKRACQIYEKICDLTGESKNAHRLVKKPIKFNETRIPQFNKTLQAFINRTKEFPDYYDVLRMLEHCNRTYSLGLVNFEIKNIAEDAFIKVGKLLQSRRKADLYETVTHYGGRDKDPAHTDPALAAKLNENQKNCKKISDILEKFARKQDTPDEEEDEDNKSENTKNCENNEKSRTSAETEGVTQLKGDIIDLDNSETAEAKENIANKETAKKAEDGESENDDEDDDDEDAADLDEHVETLANGNESDNESENENSIKDDKNDMSVDETQKDQIPTTSSATEVTVDGPKVPNIIEVCDTSHVITVDCTGNDTTNIKSASNNNNIENTETKTALNVTAKDCRTPPPNGKLKETTTLNICNSNPLTTVPLASPNKTTTTTADVRIVTVSSLKDGEIISPNDSDCSPKFFAQSTKKSLEEIVISDEES